MGRLDFSGMAAAAVVLIAASASAMFPFVPSYDSPKNVVNMSHLL